MENGRKLSSRFSLLVGVVLAAALAVYLLWSFTSHGQFAEDKALTEARMLNLSIGSAWNYIDDSQDAINYNADGSYDFKHIYCSVAGKNIAHRITRQSEGYVVRYAREDPRSGTDEPDRFEQEAIDSFRQGTATEFSRTDVYEGQPVLRYASRLDMEDNCLECHGSPAGTKDETGFLREGMSRGDLAGITSIVIPLNAYHEEAASRTLWSLLFFAALIVVVVVALRMGLRRWVERPLEEANGELARVNRAQSDFLATMSHELRTPLSSIIAYTDMWEREAVDRPAKERKMVGEIKQNSRSLLHMVNNTIDAAKMEAGLFELRLDETDLVDVVESSIAAVAGLARQQGVSIQRAVQLDAPLMHSDPFALQKILVNVLSNGVRYSERASSLTVEASVEGDRALLRVTDTGCGIPADQQEAIFKRFQQADGAHGGSGLGLYVAQTLAECLGGGISVVSEPGRGSCFTIDVPVDSAEAVTTDITEGEGGADAGSRCR